MAVWADIETIEGAPSAADVAALQADRLGALESRVHLLAAKYDDLIAALRAQRVQLAAHQAAIVRLARGKTPF